MVHDAKLQSMIAKDPNGRTPYEEVTHKTPDISEFLDFNFYDPVWYLDIPHEVDNVKIE